MEKVFIGIPILNRVDLLERCIAAIDYPADIFIVNNNTVDAQFDLQLEDLARRWRLTVLPQSRNLGISASFNLLLRTAFDRGHDSLFIGANDVFLNPGSLSAAIEFPKSDDVAIYCLHALNFFFTNRSAVEAVGWWDENFYPAYEEDIDYVYRCRLAGKRLVDVPSAGGEHVGSATIHSNPDYLAQNYVTHCQFNRDYYLRKWGGHGGEERFQSPFDYPSYDYRWWPEPDSSIADRDWDRASR